MAAGATLPALKAKLRIVEPNLSLALARGLANGAERQRLRLQVGGAQLDAAETVREITRDIKLRAGQGERTRSFARERQPLTHSHGALPRHRRHPHLGRGVSAEPRVAETLGI